MRIFIYLFILWELLINVMVDLKNKHICHDVDMTTNVKMTCGIIFKNPNYHTYQDWHFVA